MPCSARGAGCSHASSPKRQVPAAEEDGGDDRREDDDLDELGDHEQAELHPRVLDEVADDLALALGHVERRALGLGEGRGEEEQEADRLQEDAPGRDAEVERPDAPASSAHR